MTGVANDEVADVAEPAFPFFVGCGRSGTTLLRAMFDSHPDLAIPSESYFVGNLGRRAAVYERPAGFDAELFLTELLEISWVRQWGLPERALRRAFAAAPVTSFAAAVRRVFRCYADAAGKARYGDKTPNYVARMPLIAGLVPEARFVHIIRDGRDVTTSFRRVPFGPTSAAEGALFWQSRVRGGRVAGQALGVHRYREVRYEALVEDPPAVLRDLCGFLDLPFDERMLAYTDKADELMAGGRPGAHVNLALPPTKALRDWRVQMSRPDVRRFELLAGDLLEELGYPRGTEPSRADPAAAAVLRTGVRLRVDAGRGRRYVSRAMGRQPDEPVAIA